MNRTAHEMRSVAERLMAYDGTDEWTRRGKDPAEFYVIDKLRSHLAPLMGVRGFRAFLSRAHSLSIPEVPWLRAVHVKADGTLEGLEALHAQPDPAEFLAGRVVLVAHFLGLLVAFIGPSLTSRMVGEIWPQVQLDGFAVGNGGQNEKAE